MIAYRQGDALAFDALYGRHRGPTYRYLLHQCRQKDAADVIFQELWLSVVKSRSTYEPSAKFSTWLYRLARTRLIDWYRSAGRLTEFEQSLDEELSSSVEIVSPPTDNPDNQLERAQLARRLIAAIEGLPPNQRDVFLMSIEGELTVEEIGQATGAGFETAKSRLRYAYAKLRSVLADLKPT